MNCWENVIVRHSWWWNGQQSVFVVHWTSNTCLMFFFVLSFTFTTNASEWKCTDATLKIDGTLSGQEIKGTFTFNSSGVLTAPSEYSYSCVNVTMKHNKTPISFKNFQVRLMTCSSLKNSPIMDSHALCNITTYPMQYDHFFCPMEFKHHPWRIIFFMNIVNPGDPLLSWHLHVLTGFYCHLWTLWFLNHFQTADVPFFSLLVVRICSFKMTSFTLLKWIWLLSPLDLL